MKLIDELCELVKKLGKNVEKVYYYHEIKDTLARTREMI